MTATPPDGHRRGINAGVGAERLLAHYRVMTRIHAFEEVLEKVHREGRVYGAVHISIGQEAVAAGVCGNLRREDYITSTHRGHGHTIAKGADTVAMMCELFGRRGGTCQGKGGSMHIADFSVGMLGANGVVAAGIPIAVGAAHAAKLQGEDRVVACFFGDGAINRGPFLEGLNWAAVFALPVLFVCEDNGFAATTRTHAVSAGPGPAARAESLGIPATTVDGNDIAAVDEAARALVDAVRAGQGPRFLVARTYRLRGHTNADPAHYRDPDEVEAQRRRDPLDRCAALLRDLGVDDATLIDARTDARQEAEAAVAAAEAAPWPDLAEAFEDVQDIGAPAWRR